MQLIGDLVEDATVVEAVKPVVARGDKKVGAMAIYAQDQATGKARKDTISRFVAELGMTQAGASTYYQSCKQWVAT